MFERPIFINLEYVYYQLYRLITGDYHSLFSSARRLLLVILFVFALLVPVFLFAIVRVVRKLSALRQAQRVAIEGAALARVGQQRVKNARWEKVLERVASPHPAEWKLAILEADAILDEMVAGLYPRLGENLGERLKNVEPSDFPNLNEAWEAHKVRNKIAHEHNYDLTAREARLTIDRYKTIFEDFRYI